MTEDPATAIITKGSFEANIKAMQPASLQDLPVELLKQIISNLPVFARQNVMINRYLRSICEQCLYQTIILSGPPRRSLRLLETFILRPDLALLVRHLTIDVSWVDRWGAASKEIPDVLKPDGAEALTLVKNIQSLSMGDFGNWMHAPEYAGIRSVVSSMKLARLSISLIEDPMGDFGDFGPPIPEEGWDRKAVGEIRTILQAQPLLEELLIESSPLSDELLSTFQSALCSSDLPNLKSLEAVPRLAIPFTAVAFRLETLRLLPIGNWSEELFHLLKISSASIRLSLRRFRLEVWYRDEWFWDNLDKIFTLFPNLEDLCVMILTRSDAEPAIYYFEKVSLNLHVLPSLRILELQFDAFSRVNSEVGTEFVAHIKTICPLLETFIEYRIKLWTFRENSRIPGEFVPTPSRLERPSFRKRARICQLHE